MSSETIVTRLCAPLARGDEWRLDIGTMAALEITAVELEGGWAEAPEQEVAALSEVLRLGGMSVAVAQAPCRTVTVEALEAWLAHLAPLRADNLLLPTQEQPVDAAETRARLAALAATAQRHNVTLLLQNDPSGWPADGEALGRFIASAGPSCLGAYYDPSRSAGQRRHPFLTEYMPGPLKRCLRVLRLRDAVFSDGAEVLPNDGNAELKELVSAAESRGYAGWYALSPFGEGNYADRLAAAHAAVLAIVESL